MANISLGRYVPYSTPIHRMDPRAKFFIMLFLMVSIFISFTNTAMNFIMYGVLALLIFIIMWISHVRLRTILKSLKSVWMMVLFLFVINLFVIKTGDPISIFGWFTIYTNAIYNTAYIFIRLFLMISLTTILTSTTAPLELTYAIEWIFTPLKVLHFPTHEVAMTISIALRFIPTLLDETDRIMKAQASRGVDFANGKLKEKVRAIVSLIVPLLISAFQKSDELANAMEARGYDPSAKRTRYRSMKWKWGDTFGFLFGVLVLGGIITISVLKLDFVALISSWVGTL